LLVETRHSTPPLPGSPRVHKSGTPPLPRVDGLEHEDGHHRGGVYRDPNGDLCNEVHGRLTQYTSKESHKALWQEYACVYTRQHIHKWWVKSDVTLNTEWVKIKKRVGEMVNFGSGRN